jgi:serine/threonine-protein kinase
MKKMFLALVVLLTACGTPAIPDQSEFVDPKGISMRFVPKGEFTMGSNDGADEEKPAHTVNLDGFYMDKYEVTNASYKACVEAGGCEPPKADYSQTRSSYYGDSKFDNYPVIHVNWYQAKMYCQWRSARLPTEAEWEKAARGTDGRMYPWGNEFNGNIVNFCDARCSLDWANKGFNDGYEDTAPVGSYEGGVSPYGIYDMAGNVSEWVNSQFQIYPYRADDGRESAELTMGNARVLRGGAHEHQPGFLRSSFRSAGDPSGVGISLGFRCAKNAAP